MKFITQKAEEIPLCVNICVVIQGDQKVFVHLTITVQKHAKIQYFKQFHHKIHSECGPCYTRTEHGLREHSSACQ